jgi:hypothetical protein
MLDRERGQVSIGRQVAGRAQPFEETEERDAVVVIAVPRLILPA